MQYLESLKLALSFHIFIIKNFFVALGKDIKIRNGDDNI